MKTYLEIDDFILWKIRLKKKEINEFLRYS